MSVYDQVFNAVHSGRLERPDKCSSCYEKRYVVAHHDDYTKPLAVRWLCQRCHKHHHNNLMRRTLAGHPGQLSAQTGGGHTLSLESVRPSVRPPGRGVK